MKKRLDDLFAFAIALALISTLCVFMYNEGKSYQRNHQEPIISHHYLTEVIVDTVYVNDTVYLK